MYGRKEDRRERQMAQKDILGVSWMELNYETEGRWGENKGGETTEKDTKSLLLFWLHWLFAAGPAFL